jgi:hypothetical protein
MSSLPDPKFNSILKRIPVETTLEVLKFLTYKQWFALQFSNWRLAEIIKKNVNNSDWNKKVHENCRTKHFLFLPQLMTKRTGEAAHLSPLMNRLSDSSGARNKLLKELEECHLPSELADDPRVPPYAKIMLEKVDRLLKAVVVLFTDQPSPFEAIDEVRREHSLVVAGLPESAATLPTKRCEDDYNQVKQILDISNVEQLPVSVYRMGKAGPRPRLLKIELATRKAVRDVLRNGKKCKEKFHNIQIRESLSLQQRQQHKTLVDECKQKRLDTGLDYVLYAGEILTRQEIEERKNKNSRHV